MAPGNTDIRYVCLSDMHLGEEDSLLTHVNPENGEADPTERSPVLQELATCLTDLIGHNKDQAQQPTLILMGDILELALTTDNIAAMAFERFLELFMAKNYELFDKIIFIPGNHDHHLWESARETQYVLNYLANTKPQDIPGTSLAYHQYLHGRRPQSGAFLFSQCADASLSPSSEPRNSYGLSQFRPEAGDPLCALSSRTLH